MNEIRDKWDAVYQGSGLTAVPSRVLQENAHLLPTSGKGLEIACGQAANARYLCVAGLDVTAWDISPVIISKLNQFAIDNQISLRCEARDVEKSPPEANSFDVIVVSHYLDRELVPHIIDALRPNGLVYYQTFTREKVGDAGPKNENFRLADNELLALFKGLRILVYREEARVGDIQQGFRDEALIVAQKI
ncbi:MAG: class I SAM-dependent methyltransferase [Gammaproteobacteria bacterium]